MPSIDLTPYYQPQGATSDGNKLDNGYGLIQSTMNGLDNNNIAANAAIVASKLNGLATVVGTQNVGSANTDLVTPGASRSALYVVTTGTGTLRSIGAPTENGSRVLVRNGSGSSITLKHQLAGGTGAQLYLRTVADVTLLDKEIVEFAYDGTNWVEVNRDQATAGGGTQGTELDYKQITADVSVTAGNTNESNALAVVTGNSITYDGTKCKVEFFCERFDNGAHQPTLVLYRDAAVLADFGPYNSASAFPVKLEIFDTPAAGAHTYAVKIFDSGGTTGAVVRAGAGGAGAAAPAFLRVTKA